MLSKETKIEKIEIVGEYKHIQVLEAIIVYEDGVELSRKGHRRVISPIDDVTNEPVEIQSVSYIFHSQDIKDAYTAYLASVEME